METEPQAMSINSRDERVKQIRERLEVHRAEVTKYRSGEWAKGVALNYHEAPDDIDFLLSLLDGQSKLARELALIVDVGTSDDPGTAITKLRKLEHAAATRMRERCVEKVRDALLDHAEMCGDALYCNCGTAANRQL